MIYFLTLLTIVLTTICIILLIQRKKDKEALDNKIDQLDKSHKDLILNITKEIAKLNQNIIKTLTDQTTENKNSLTEVKDSCLERIKQAELKNDLNQETTKEALDKLNKWVQQVVEDNKKFKKIIENITEIGNDSQNLNLVEDVKEQEQTIDKALEELKSSETINIEQTNIDITNKAQDPTKLVLDDDQLKAINLLETTNKNYFITGRAGTGKSFLLKLFERSTKKKVLKTAPTGIAALNIEGATLHSAFGFNNLSGLDIDDINNDNIKLKSEKKLVLKNIDTLIIDEISMVRVDILEKINRILQIVNNNDKPFGGKQIILFGDLFQLPPIADKKETKYLKNKYGGIYFFFSPIYKNSKFTFIELTNNHRQKQDISFFNILNNIREGLLLDADLEVLNNRTKYNKDELRRIVRILPKKEDAERINKEELNKIVAKEYVFEAKVVENILQNQNIVIEKMFPITEKLKLKIGCLIMFVANDPNKKWVNGTLGIVSYITDNVIKVKINNIEYEIHKETFKAQEAIIENNKIYYQTIFAVEQYPIVLAYAITIHKSQGMTYQKIACDINNCFATGQAYVALSRCISINGLFLLNKIDTSDISVDNDVKDFYIKQKNID